MNPNTASHLLTYLQTLPLIQAPPPSPQEAQPRPHHLTCLGNRNSECPICAALERADAALDQAERWLIQREINAREEERLWREHMEQQRILDEQRLAEVEIERELRDMRTRWAEEDGYAAEFAGEQERIWNEWDAEVRELNGLREMVRNRVGYERERVWIVREEDNWGENEEEFQEGESTEGERQEERQEQSQEETEAERLWNEWKAEWDLRATNRRWVEEDDHGTDFMDEDEDENDGDDEVSEESQEDCDSAWEDEDPENGEFSEEGGEAAEIAGIGEDAEEADWDMLQPDDLELWDWDEV